MIVGCVIRSIKNGPKFNNHNDTTQGRLKL